VDSYTSKLKKYQDNCAGEIAEIQHQYIRKINKLHKSFKGHNNSLQDELDAALGAEASVDLREICPDWANLKHRPLMWSYHPSLRGITVIWENRLKTRQLRSADQALARAEEELRTIALSLGRPYSKELITLLCRCMMHSYRNTEESSVAS